MRQYVAGLDDAAGIDGDVSFVDVLNDPLFVDHKSCAITKPLFLIKDSVVLYHSTLEVAEDGKREPELFGKLPIGRNTVYAKPENLSVGSIEFGDISLIRLKFLRSTTGEREHVGCDHHVLGTLKIAQLVGLAVRSA